MLEQRTELIGNTMASMRNDDLYYEYLRKIKPAKGYWCCQMAEKEVFANWCEKCNFKIFESNVIINAPGLKNNCIKIGHYEIGPDPKMIVFSYNVCNLPIR